MVSNVVAKNWAPLTVFGGRRYSTNAAPAAPSWVTGASPNVWGVVPGTTAGTIRAVAAAVGANTGSDQASILDKWSSLAWDSVRKALYCVKNGGHGDWAGNEAYECPINAETTAFARLTDPSTSAAPSQVVNSDSLRGDGSAAADHTYSITQYAAGRIWFPGVGAMAGSTGFSSTAITSWSKDDISNGALGYSYHGKARASYSGSADCDLYNSCSAYDPVGRKIWYVGQGSSNGGVTMWSVDVDSPYTITTYSPNIGGFVHTWMVCIPSLRILLANGRNGYSNQLWRYDIASPGGEWVSCTESGTRRSEQGDGFMFQASANGGLGKIYVWPQAGNTFHVISIPSTASGTYAWSTASVTGAAPPTPINGVWKKMHFVDDIGGGEQIILACMTVDDPVHFIRVASSGL